MDKTKKKLDVMVYHVFQLFIVSLYTWFSEVVEYYDVDEDADQASRETKDPCYDADDGEDHGDGSSPRLT